MLQQTQVSRVLEKFTPFVERFATIEALASAAEDEVLAMWSGLGYYRRARMLHKCAQAVVEHHAGVIPSDIKSLQALPGVGRYTAGAIASIVFRQSTPIVDGNVTRILQRIHNNPSPQTDKATIQWAWAQAEQLADCAHNPGVLNEAMMELGATICTPKNIRCDQCPVRNQCLAFDAGTTEQIPPPKPKAKQKTIYCASAVVRNKAGALLVEQRPPEGMWGGLFQAPTLEDSSRQPTPEELGALLGCGPADLRERESFTHITTHRIVQFVLYSCIQTELPANGRRYIPEPELHTLGISNAQKRILHSLDTITQ